MNIKTINDVAIVNSDEIIIKDTQPAIDFIMSVKYETNCSKIAINKEAIIEIRNYFKIGDKVTIFDKNNDYSFVIKTMKDIDGNDIDIARHPKEIIRINCDYKVLKNSLMRVNFLD